MKFILTYFATLLFGSLSQAHKAISPVQIIIENDAEVLQPLAIYVRQNKSNLTGSSIKRIYYLDSELVIEKAADVSIEQLIFEIEEITNKEIEVRSVSPEQIRLGSQDDMV